VKLQTFYELFKGTVFTLLGIMILVFGPQYLTLLPWQRWAFGIVLVAYGAYKFFLARKYQQRGS